ncbi:MAG: ABC transporter permease [Planctomycetota bacterium]
MNRTLILLRRELLSTFVSPVSWIILVLFLLVMGANMYISIVAVGGDLRQLLSSAYGGLVFWFMFLVIPPLVTMRSLAEEHRQGALEVLMVTGISDASVVIAKWAASSIFYFTLWLCLLPLWGVLSLVGDVEPGLLFTTHVGIFFIGSAFCANGILASALTAHPLAAAGLSFTFNIALFMVHFFSNLFRPGEIELLWIEHVSAIHHMVDELTRGILDLRVPVFWFTLILFSLFLATRVLERRRWA